MGHPYYDEVEALGDIIADLSDTVNNTKRLLLDYVAKVDVSLDFMIPYYYLRRQTDTHCFRILSLTMNDGQHLETRSVFWEKS